VSYWNERIKKITLIESSESATGNACVRFFFFFFLKYLSTTMLRSVVNDYFIVNRTFEEFEKLSEAMNHSIETAQSHYNKLHPANRTRAAIAIMNEIYDIETLASNPVSSVPKRMVNLFLFLFLNYTGLD
jgi:hypothetical protein